MTRRSHPLVRAAAAALVAVTLLGGAGCTAATQAAPADQAVIASLDGIDRSAFVTRHPGLFVVDERTPGMESVAVLNYDPKRLPPPARQDTVGYGHLSSDPTHREFVVYQVWVQEGEKKFYIADFDKSTRAKVHEEGSWFLSEDQDAYVGRQLAVIDDLLGERA